MRSPTTDDFALAAYCHPETTNVHGPPPPVPSPPPSPPPARTSALFDFINGITGFEPGTPRRAGNRGPESLNAGLITYKRDTLPSILLDSRTSLLRNVSQESIDAWKAAGGHRLIVQPFDFNPKPSARNAEPYATRIQQHLRNVKNFLCDALGTTQMTVEAPQLTISAVVKGQHPASLLISGITEQTARRALAKEILVRPGSLAITIYRFDPLPYPTLMACLGNFRAGTTDDEVIRIVTECWSSKPAASIIGRMLESGRPDRELGIHTIGDIHENWIESIEVTHYDHPEGRTFSVLANPLADSDDQIRAFHNLISTMDYNRYGCGDGRIIPFMYCRYCNGRDHQLSACPFLEWPGWLGPRFYSANSRIHRLQGHPNFPAQRV